jgi:NAD(P)-dependent dehydrogenase (short-subunit alcohol dehydrogenase family)
MEIAESFRGSGCVVTGAASGIGFAVSEALLQAGAAVFLADVDRKMLDSAAKRLHAHARQLHTVHVDVTCWEQVNRLVQDAASCHGRLDYLFNNAGIGGGLPIADATLEQWRRIIDINLWGVIYGIHAVLPIMRSQGSGHIINTASIAGLVPVPFQALYNTTKYAVVGLSETMRYELADDGIHVSVVCPGAVATPIWGKPIIGKAVDVKPPAEAIPADEAARIILAGVANKEGIIALPESSRSLWHEHCRFSEAVDRMLVNMARQRRATFESQRTASTDNREPPSSPRPRHE